ncbi:YkgJ family cysteine cluster protein [Halopiger djelfimassiliensis]|uniref:YkgJ family cysteine cluster protein n=1 Tax=Halopiger djelfimassiliensis TaxID=1293047 RepID=UPI00067797A4|nr:YkgJ family cysteine cluster protein [Halopiger djelfimassiliensis]
MEVNCEGCAGCCLDWKPLLEETEGGTARRARGSFGDGEADRRVPLDDDPNFVPLTREEVRTFLERGQAAALTPRFWHAREENEGVEIDGYRVAAVAGRPAFFVGLRKPPKPVAPVGRSEPSWLPTCVFLDPTTLQCRIHDTELYPDECSAYPTHNLALEHETECERVEAAAGGERLLDRDVEHEPESLLLGVQAIGEKLFCHPDPDALEGLIRRCANGDLTAADRAECLAVAAASSPGTLATSDHHYEWGRERALAAMVDGDEPARNDDSSWVGPAIREWHRRRTAADGAVPSADIAAAIETARGAPETPGWDALE